MKTLHSILIFILMISTTFNSSAQNNDSKILVAYYSYSGNTKAVAEQIQKGTDGDLFEIQPIKPYSKNYQEVVDQVDPLSSSCEIHNSIFKKIVQNKLSKI